MIIIAISVFMLLAGLVVFSTSTVSPPKVVPSRLKTSSGEFVQHQDGTIKKVVDGQEIPASDEEKEAFRRSNKALESVQRGQ